jgi:anti-anti-sigma factor
MRMSTAHDGPGAVVCLTGRLDGESARHLSDTIEDLLRDGARSIELDMGGVDYLSSAGMRVLARRAEDLATLRGTLHVLSPSAVARDALTAAGLAPSLIREGQTTRISARSTRSTFTQWGVPALSAHHGSYEVSRYSDQGVRCRLYGNGESPFRGPARAEQCRTVEFPPESFGIGIGAIGSTFEATGPRFGELLAAEGVVTYRPTDGAGIPDFMLSYGERAPTAVLHSGITWRGQFSDLMRFTIQPSADDIPLAELAEVCVEMTGSEAVVIAAVAEMTGIVGMSLRRPITALPEGFQYESGAGKLRDWVSFTPEPAHQGSTAMLLGVVARRPTGPLAAYLRPFDAAGVLQGHLHAAVFPYSPVPQRTVLLPALVGRLFQTLPVRDVMHVITDDRGESGESATGLLRGVCWMARIESAELVP